MNFFFVLLASMASVLNPLCDGKKGSVFTDSVSPAFSWSVSSERGDVVQKAYRITVYDGKELVWDSGKVRSDESACVRYSGAALKPDTRYVWNLRTWYDGCKSLKSSGMSFNTALLSDGDWNDADWIAYEADRGPVLDGNGKFVHHYVPLDLEWQDRRIGDYVLPEFRREFSLERKPVRATAYVCGLGQFEFYLNGQKVGDHFLDPGWTAYDKEALYVAFDILPLLEDDNAAGIMLGNGFFNIPNERYYKITGSFGVPRVKLLMSFEYEDGSREEIVSDSSWKSSPSPITFSSVYRGESYDARLEQPGWSLPGFDGSSWTTAVLLEGYSPVLRLQRHDVKEITELYPESETPTGNGVTYDMGRNCSGIFNIKVRGDEGSSVRVWPAESLDGNVVISQLGSGGPTFFEYTLKGEGEEIWQPRFSYYGQRYFYVEGDAEVLGFKAKHTSADLAPAGRFRCSNKLFNDALEIIDRAFRSNASSLFTDCPHREKLGWLEQTYLMFDSFASMYEVHDMLGKTIRDCVASQLPNGCVPTIAPEYVRFMGGFEDTPEWGSALIIVAWNLYKWYGDDSFIRSFYPEMKRFAEYLASRRGEDGVVAYGLNDWLTTDPSTSIGVTSHMMYVYDLALLNNMAALLGNREDAEYFDKMHGEAVDAFNKRFWDPVEMVYDADTQADNAAALYFGMVPQDRLHRVADNLLRSIMASDWAVTAGECTHPYMLEVLSAMGRDDVISKMHNQRAKPGYGYILDKGATTLTEAWDGTLSQNHFANGHLVQWLYGGLAGIGQTEESVAFRHLTIEPRVVDEVNWIDCSFETPYGTVVSNWTRKSDGVHYHIVIPAGCDAAVRLPGYKATLGSGAYDFVR